MLKTGIRKYDIFKLYYWHGATLVGKYRLPQLKPTKYVPKNVISYNERNGIKNPENHWVDYFIDDSLFESFWNAPERSIERLKKFAGVITTDFSTFPEMLPGQSIWNITRNREIAYYMQVHKNLKIIPVASWCREDDLEWCFDGLSADSSIAVSTNGCLSSPYGKKVFLKGIEELQKQKHPFKIIVCGRPLKDLGKYENILYYPCFSQRMEDRIKNGR